MSLNTYLPESGLSHAYISRQMGSSCHSRFNHIQFLQLSDSVFMHVKMLFILLFFLAEEEESEFEKGSKLELERYVCKKISFLTGRCTGWRRLSGLIPSSSSTYKLPIFLQTFQETGVSHFQDPVEALKPLCPSQCQLNKWIYKFVEEAAPKISQ